MFDRSSKPPLRTCTSARRKLLGKLLGQLVEVVQLVRKHLPRGELLLQLLQLLLSQAPLVLLGGGRRMRPVQPRRGHSVLLLLLLLLWGGIVVGVLRVGHAVTKVALLGLVGVGRGARLCWLLRIGDLRKDEMHVRVCLGGSKQAAHAAAFSDFQQI